MANSLGHCTRFRPYPGKDSIMQEFENLGLGLGASVVANLAIKIPVIQTSNYHFVLDNYLTNPAC